MISSTEQTIRIVDYFVFEGQEILIGSLLASAGPAAEITLSGRIFPHVHFTSKVLAQPKSLQYREQWSMCHVVGVQRNTICDLPLPEALAINVSDEFTCYAARSVNPRPVGK